MIIFRVRDRLAIVGYHERIANALERRDAEMAVAAVQDLIRYTRDQYVAADEARQKNARTGSSV
jgi:DNA-binding GntR family transcriptional regulator